MKIKSLFLAALACGSLAFTACNGTEAKDPLKTETSSPADADFSKALGVLFAQNLKQMGLESKDLNSQIFAQTISDILDGKETMTMDQASQIVQPKIQELQAKQAEAEKAKHTGNIDAGKKYLAENGAKKGVVTTASGLQYEVLKDGKGGKPSLSSKVKVHYHGTLIDGTVFDSSVERGEPIEFPLNGVIQGWQEGVQLMNKGSKFRFVIPYELAYGERAAGKIPPYSTLIFEVELLDFK